MVQVAVNYKKLTVAQLKEELMSRCLETTGKKADLITRLEDHDKELGSIFHNIRFFNRPVLRDKHFQLMRIQCLFNYFFTIPVYVLQFHQV